MTPNAPERWVTKLAVTEHLGVESVTVDRLLKEGLPHIRISPSPTGRLRFRLSEVDAWLAQRTENAR